jgi:hypothetical protein
MRVMARMHQYRAPFSGPEDKEGWRVLLIGGKAS